MIEKLKTCQHCRDTNRNAKVTIHKKNGFIGVTSFKHGYLPVRNAHIDDSVWRAAVTSVAKPLLTRWKILWWLLSGFFDESFVTAAHLLVHSRSWQLSDTQNDVHQI